MKKYLFPAALFVLGFAAALVIMREPLARETSAETATATETVDAAALAEFLAAVSKGDFPAMRDLGGRLFPKGCTIENAEQTFAGYETNSFPPYTVYALHTDNAPDAVRRVLLTVDAEGRVESFLAEEMKIAE